MPEPTPGQRRIELFVREGLPEPTRRLRRDLATAVKQLEDDGVVSSASVTTCPKRYPIDEEIAAAPFVSFEEWATGADVSLAPAFGTRMCYSVETGRRRRYRIVPAFVMAVYEGDQLQAVYPHVDDTPNSVLDGIEALRSRGATEGLSGLAERGAAD